MRHGRNGNGRHAAPPVTFDELLAKVGDLPPGWRGEILDGEVHAAEASSAARAHALAEIQASLVAGSASGDPAPEGWTFVPGAEITAGHESLLVADVAGWQLPKAAVASTRVGIAPAWVCEVPAPIARRFARTDKRRAWLERGVRHLWMVDVDARVLEVFQASGGRWVLVDALTERDGAALPPFETLHFDVGDLWLPQPPPSPAPPSSRRRAGV